MKFATACTLLALARASGKETKDHPIVKVIAMIEGLKEKAIAEGKEEAVSYGKFTYWCSTTKSELSDEIANSKETISELEDTIAGKKKQSETLKAAIEKLEDQIGELEASAKNAKDDRKDEAALYDKVSKDLKKTIKAMEDCIKALQNAEKSTESMLLAQKSVNKLIALISVKASEQEVKSLVDFTGRPDQKAKGDLAKHTDKYDFKSENVVELLKQLKMKFEDDKLAADKAETNSLNAYSLSKEARDNAIDAAKKSKDKKGKELAATQKALKDAQADLKNENSDLKADSKSLSATDESCAIKKTEWEERSATRANEVESMDVAIKILAKATGVRTKAPGNPIPPANPVDFLQVSSLPASDPKMKAIELLRTTAKNEHSRALETFTMQVAAHLTGPFDEVNNMIEKMIFRLMDEQKKEDEHKLWCDQEIKKTDTMKEDKEDKIKDLKAEIKTEKATVSKLSDDITNSDKMIADIVAFMKEATEIRNTGKKENNHAIKDAQDAQTAVTNAIAVLEAFYKESGSIKKEPWEFIQKPAALGKKPSTWESGYTGVADPKAQPGGIVAVLETINAGFSKMEAETRSQEQVDQKEFEEDIKANEIEKARRTQESEMKNAEKARRNDKIATLSSEMKNTDAELEKTNQYLEDLKPACVDGDSKYEDRKAARAKEIKALGEAQVILKDAFAEKAPAKKFLQVHRHQ